MSYSIKRVRNSEFVSAIDEIRKNKVYLADNSGGAYLFVKIPNGHRYIQKLIVLTYNSNIIGWSVVVKDTDKQKYVWVYVSKAHRRKGFGSKLLNEAKKYFKTTLHYCSDISNYRFWNKVEDTRLQNSEFWMNIYEKAV